MIVPLDDLFLPANSSGKRRRGEQANCLECSVSFIRRKSHSNGKKIFCGQNCFHKHSNKNKQVVVSCYICAVSIIRSKSKVALSKSGLSFCSRLCKDKAQRISSGVKAIQPCHYGQECQTYREVAKRTRPFVCCDCGLFFEPLLTVHHIDGNSKNNNPENLEVLCFTHHALRHLMLDGEGKWILSYKRGLTPRSMIEVLLNR